VKKDGILGYLALLGVLALVFPSVLQELQWQLYKEYDVPFEPTPPVVVEEMLSLVDIKSGDLLYDLGCGDGRIVIAAAKKYGIRAIGIDIDPVLITESNENAAKEGVTDKVRFIQQNLFEADFKDATIVTMYLLRSVNLRLRPKLLADLKPGTRLVSHNFDMGEWKPDKARVITTAYDGQRDVYFWVVPANLTGRWEWDLVDGSRNRRYTLQTNQQFQVMSASGMAGDWPLTIQDVGLVGDEMKFRLDAEADGKMVSFLYRGKVQGDTITGTVMPANNPKAVAVKWRAFRDPKTVEPLDKAPEARPAQSGAKAWEDMAGKTTEPIWRIGSSSWL